MDGKGDNVNHLLEMIEYKQLMRVYQTVEYCSFEEGAIPRPLIYVNCCD